MSKKYVIALTSDERASLSELIESGEAPQRQRTHAQILLYADVHQANGGYKDAEICALAHTSSATISRVRQRFVREGMTAALYHKEPKSRTPHRLDQEQQARLIELVDSNPPEGQTHWTLRSLANQMIKCGYVERLSYQTVRRTLKKVHR